MSVLLPVTVVLAVLAIIGATAYASYLGEKKRTDELRQIATELGFDFIADGDAAFLQSLSGFHLFLQGHSKKLSNLLRGRSQDLDVAIFDYRYITGHGKHRHTSSQSAIRFQFTEQRLPNFSLRPEGLSQKIGALLGYQDIDFESHPTFSKRYLLRGTNEQAIRQSFNTKVLDYFEQQPGLYIEAAGDTLLFYRHRNRVRTANMRSFLEQGFDVYSLFRSPSETDKSTT